LLHGCNGGGSHSIDYLKSLWMIVSGVSDDELVLQKADSEHAAGGAPDQRSAIG
jgi:hypothetical protein